VSRSRLLVVTAILAGLTSGIGGYTIVYAKGYSDTIQPPRGRGL
jgi:predicted RND superfamily exporter protein